MLSKKSILFISLLLIFAACYTPKPQAPGIGTYINLANLYRPQATTIFPEFVVYNKNDSVSTVYNYIYLPNLMFHPSGQYSQAKVLFSYRLTPSLTNREILDTITKTIVIKYNQRQKNLVFPVDIPIPRDSSYLITIYVKDLYRKRSNLKFISNDPGNPFCANDFLVSDAQTFKPIFTHVISSQDFYLIRHNSGAKRLFAYHYPQDTLLPKPPFYIGSRGHRIYADTIIDFNAMQPVRFTTKGIYIITQDSLQQHGKTLVVFSSDFPQVKRASEMIGPLAYLTNSYEFQQIRSAYSPKLAVDSFWLSITETPQQAKDLIRVYYNRVFLANYYFTTHKQGWMTDRGMIYIVFGAPPIVYKFDNQEVWVYYFAQKHTYITFKFKRIKTRFFNEDYVLSPSASYREFWQFAVGQWRSGIVPSL